MADGGLQVSAHQDGPIRLAVDFTCAPGDVLAIFGPSGSGKTTILRTIAGLHTPREGRIRVDGKSGSTPRTASTCRHTTVPSGSCSRSTRSSRT